MDDLKYFFKDNYLQYASYVILDRAIPDIVDGLKPVQRRILWTLFQMDNGKLHKVANVSGQTMALHPHGDAAITDALVHLANKGFLLDTQGNFGNPLTGDPAAAARYIETRLSQLAKETLFNPHLTNFLPSYDGRSNEPVVLPAKIPLLLMQGADGIAVGMATKILPHNFTELLQAQIAYLEGRSFSLLPDFPSGGSMDPSDYQDGNGKIKLRARIDVVDEKTLVIKEICYGTTTESLIRSIDEAAKKGKIKIDTINDYTADKIEIEIKLPRGVYAAKMIDLLYAFTECEVALHPQMVVIKERMPWEGTASEILIFHTKLLLGYLQKELEHERDLLLERIYEKTLEQIFIENRLYKKIENIATYELVHATIEEALIPFHPKLARVPSHDDRERLLAIPIRRISLFDRDKSQKEILDYGRKLEEVQKNLKDIKKFTIKYLQSLLKKYGSLFPRRTSMKTIEELDRRAISEHVVKVGYDATTGFIGTKINSDCILECSNLDKLLLVFDNGEYRVIAICDKSFVQPEGAKLVWLGKADKTTTLNVIYSDKNGFTYAKRFVVKQFILDKDYKYLEEGDTLEYLTTENDASFELYFKAKPKQKVSSLLFSFENVLIKGVAARGIRIANKSIEKVKVIQEAKV